MVQCGRDLVLVEICAVVAVDQKRYAAAAVDVARPTESVIERSEFLEQVLVLLQRRDGLGAARADIDAIAHEFPPRVALKMQKGAGPCGHGSPCLEENIVSKWADRKAMSGALTPSSRKPYHPKSRQHRGDLCA